ncbi:MAG: hypothetical protein AAF236_06730 [Verrucomicrobiota bacterium]
MARPSKTFLIEAGATRFRVDLTQQAGSFAVSGVYHPEAPPTAAPGSPPALPVDAFDPRGGTLSSDWIAPLLKIRPRPAAEVTILSDQITAVVAEIPAGPGEDWRSSAEMEAQTVSGLSSSEAVVSTTQLPAESGMVCCWVAQVAMRDVAAMRSAVSSVSGTRLVSVGHPGGIKLDPAAAQLESWDEYSLFQAAGSDRIEIRAWNGPDALTEASEDGAVAAALVDPENSTRLLLASKESLPSAEKTAKLLKFSDRPSADQWAAALARACDPLTGQLLALPVINVPKPPPTAAALAITSALIAAATLVLLGGHYLLNQFNKKRLEANIEELQAPAQRVAAARTKITELKRELKEIEDEQAEVGESDVNVYAHRRRIGALLDGISAGAGVDGVVVMEFRPDELDTIITGAAASFNAPQTLASEIDEALAENGWRASLVRRTAKLLRADGGPWSYEIRLNPGRPVSVDDPPVGTGDEAARDRFDPQARVGETTGTVVF